MDDESELLSADTPSLSDVKSFFNTVFYTIVQASTGVWKTSQSVSPQNDAEDYTMLKITW